jgi:predicted extracellular nuclease
VRSAGEKANVIVAGDLNAFDFSTQVKTLTATGLLDLPATLPIAQRYTYVYEGNSEVLDQILLSPALARQPYSYQVVHVNAEYAVQASDHDPAVVRLRLK